ncbi:MAG: NAD(P)/FAD-dependent oxidoreductase [Lachnospiraceae bacterium]|nr:NAD(P)/FAD-dependent oxidoreductase [Lachnospiraceae bacterium]
MQKKIAIIGCGASGMMAAITASRHGAEVTIYEHSKPGKKILSTGNGKCNLTNEDMKVEYFSTHATGRLRSCLTRFGKEETKEFFKDLGLILKEKNGYYYPLSEQASMVQQILVNELGVQNVTIICDVIIKEISPCKKQCAGKRWKVITDKEHNFYDAVILACGSKAAPKTGSDGSGYEFAKKFGHKLVPVLPALVQLRCKDTFCKELSGIRTEATIHIVCDNKELCCERGELQLTDYGISGIPVFQLSGKVNRYLFENKKAELIAHIDFLPCFNGEEWDVFIKERLTAFQNFTIERFFCGILNQKIMNLLIKSAQLNPRDLVKASNKNKLLQVFQMCRSFTFHIEGSNGFDQAQVCTGGVDLNEVTDDLESIYAPQIYFAGEILDVDGRCGGYNLQWAWTSGFIAGEAAAQR